MLRVDLGALVIYDSQECIVIEANASVARLRQLAGGHDTWIDVPSAAAAGLLRLISQPAPADATPSGVFTSEQLAGARQRELHLLEVRNGLDTPDLSRPGMCASSLTERRAAKARGTWRQYPHTVELGPGVHRRRTARTHRSPRGEQRRQAPQRVR